MKNSRLRFVSAPLLGALLTLPSLSNAATWEVDAVLNGTDNFGFSVLHTANAPADGTSAPMSGTIIDRLDTLDTTTTRTFIINDTTGIGDLDVTFNLEDGGTMRLHGALDFGSNSDVWLDTEAEISADFTGMNTNNHSNTAFNFAVGDQCCTTNNYEDPNSFFIDTDGFAYMTLWGANGDLSGGVWTPETTVADRLGMDLRIKLRNIDSELAVVPIPAAFWLFGSALLGFSAVARRQRSKQTNC